MVSVITASEPSWTAPFTGLSQHCSDTLLTTNPPRPDRHRRRYPARSRAVGQPLAGDRIACDGRTAWEESGAKAATAKTWTIADGGYPGTGLVSPLCRARARLTPGLKEEHNKSHKQVRARTERVFAP
ncbi:hypothetical protein KMT30_03210 [Streptomyces sp. IBSBF 2953]|nr:hypothetical protein [Streptomyces hayashii]